MGSVAILTDSTADLSPQQAAAAGITVVPLYVRFGAEEFRAGVDLTTEAFWTKLLAAGADHPTTAAPSPGDFTAAFTAAFDAGAEAIVCPTIGHKLSATVQSARLAAAGMDGREIHVIDTRSTSMSTGIAALLASELAAQGRAAADIAAAVEDRLDDIDLYVAVDTLEYLRRGGRLSAAQAVVGSMLSVKPIITVRDGAVVMSDRERSRAKARAKALSLIAAAPLERLAILHTPTSSPDEVDAFRAAVVAAVPGGIDPSRVTTGIIGASTGPHLGPDLMGAALLRARR